MRNCGYWVATLLLLAVGISAARQLQLANPVYVIDPWALGMKYPPVKLAPNTVVKFNWKGLGKHGVYRIPTGECPIEFKHKPSEGIIELAPITDGGEYTTMPLAPGTYWHACPRSPGRK
ncbi:hypothetical protein COCOBI_01-7620 [Coccomyxa sp. Obi]|nr:hypothetical protein COCOBI_01-7620 [Coccomyxa sp. Obi]